MKTNQQKEAAVVSRSNDLIGNSTPRRIDRKRGAALITDLYFQISPRTLEKWPIAWRYANGRATCETDELLNYAKSKLDAAPAIKGGPPYRKFGPRPLYRWGDALEWASGMLAPVHHSTSEADTFRAIVAPQTVKST